MNPFIERIERLLATDRTAEARSCEEILARGVPSLDSIQLPLKHIQRIYGRRARINTKRGAPIKGFDNLIRNLNEEQSPNIGIQTIRVGAESFSVFTTSDVTRIIGILLFPPVNQEQQSWFQ